MTTTRSASTRGRTPLRSTAVSSRRSSRPQSRGKPASQPDLSKLGTFPPPTETSEQMAVENTLLAMDCANRFARSNDMQVVDLETPAWVGLLKACRLYDPSKINPNTGKPYALSSFAVPYIKGAMRQYVRDKTFAIRFPNRWRELGPKVRRLHQEGRTPKAIVEEVNQAAGAELLTIEEAIEIIQCQKPTIELNHDRATDGPDDRLVIEEEDDLGLLKFQHAVEIGMRALGKICSSDRDTIRQWFTDARSMPYPSGPIQQFRGRVREVVGAENAPGGMELQPLGFGVLTAGGKVPGGKRAHNPRSRRTPEELTRDAEQVDLFAMDFGPDDTEREP
jgi:DNA-directed RNA polymerase specialized sigma subunit